MDDAHSQEEFIRQVLEAYRKTPGTTGTVRHADRILAAQLYQRGISVSVIENAFVLAAVRRRAFPSPALPRPWKTSRTWRCMRRFIEASVMESSATNSMNSELQM